MDMFFFAKSPYKYGFGKVSFLGLSFPFWAQKLDWIEDWGAREEIVMQSLASWICNDHQNSNDAQYKIDPQF